MDTVNSKIFYIFAPVWLLRAAICFDIKTSDHKLTIQIKYIVKK